VPAHFTALFCIEKNMVSKAELVRRIRLNDHTKYLRGRYGYELPDDDAGREDLYELLLTVSLGEGADRKMRMAIELWAPWISGEEASGIIDNINRTPDHERKRNKRDLGERWGLTYEERLKWGIRTVAPCDLTEAEFDQRRKDRRAWLRWKRRHDAGQRTREQYRASFANSLSRTKPWKAERMSRAKWYRQGKHQRQGVVLRQAVSQ
jgi:hypothetical protein